MSTDSNYGKFAIIENFQPMPKRFMVWDKKEERFLTYLGTKVVDFEYLLILIDHYSISLSEFGSRYILVQSTNLFDKYGKEIFEGSIIHTLQAKWVVKEDKGCMCAFNYRSHIVMPLYKLDMMATENIGHILSNPELVGE